MNSDSFMPILPSDITFEICTTSDPHQDDFEADDESNNSTSNSPACGDELKKSNTGGIHFLTSDVKDPLTTSTATSMATAAMADTEPEVRKQLLEYLIQNDGSVVCKWCGEVLPSRTRWYRHKYKLHVTTTSSTQQSQSAQPQPLFKCHSCNAYFKSRKGYIGHLSSRHSSDENDENREEQPRHYHYHHHHNNNKSNSTKTVIRKPADIGKGPDWEQQREKEEKLVADIIDRVKRECEAQGEIVTRRGYSRRTNVMNSSS
ncbi:uncharacterized protein LOC131673520 [Phymastichus coffea]|uniref:uncharacterized protein LOC131673520 n=1 Tax=Phymastichus coffea TaxID=108790 RepID=UPI00273C9880|nr:uncharacterized protein LOC131673520 [Phymastichus coffea]